MSEDNSTRLRAHPVARFEGAQHVLDLQKAIDDLQGESHAPTRGHRQVALFHYGSVTMVLFAFEAGGSLPDHKAEGLVTIHVLDGALTVEAEGHTHELGARQILALNPGIRHDVQAREASHMLLTVHLHGAKHQDAPRRAESAALENTAVKNTPDAGAA